MKIKIEHGDIHLVDLKTRLPFKYGIATMTSAPHAFVRLRVEVDGREFVGIAADHLPPKWFTKLPEKPLDQEIDEMLESIEHAVDVAVGMRGDSVYDIWDELNTAQQALQREEGFPPLLSNFGCTLVERALIEAFAKSAEQPFSKVVRSNLLGIPLSRWDWRLEHAAIEDLLPREPRKQVIARHTIGMADPLTENEITIEERLDDGLPQSLVECIRRYGLRHFKVKVSGDVDHDLDRLSRIAEVITANAPADFAFTMDGNEQFHTLEDFQQCWRTLTGTERLRSFFEHLLFVEQPFHRDVALDPEVLGGLSTWNERPPLIIDESDAERDSMIAAVNLGYHGTSHKNCKGVIKGIINACLLEQLRREESPGPFIMSGEDLANIGPVALLQDLAVAATLGVESIERNGHHYFAGLSAFPESVQQQVLASHGDLYRQSEAGWPTLDINNGNLDLSTVLRSPLGVDFELDVEQFLSVEDWRRSREPSA